MPLTRATTKRSKTNDNIHLCFLKYIPILDSTKVDTNRIEEKQNMLTPITKKQKTAAHTKEANPLFKIISTPPIVLEETNITQVNNK